MNGLILLLLALVFMDSVQAGIPIQQLTVTTFKQYYVIKRLHETVSYLKNINQNLKQRSHLIAQLASKKPILSNKAVAASIQACLASNNLQPFIDLWLDVLRYKTTEDETFLPDAILQLFSITKQSLLNQASKTTSPQIYRCVATKLSSIDRLSPDELIDVISLCTDCLAAPTCDRNKLIEQLCAYVDSALHRSAFSETHITCDQIIYRRYLLNRLKLHIGRLRTKNISNSLLKAPPAFSSRLHLRTHCPWHASVKQAYEALCDHGCSEKLLTIWSELHNYKYIQHEEIVADFVRTLCIAHYHIYINLCGSSPEPNRRSSEHITQIYEHLENLPIDELLDAIDLIAYEIRQIYVQDQEIQAPQKATWFTYIVRKYWSIFFAISTIIYKSVQHYAKATTTLPDETKSLTPGRP